MEETEIKKKPNIYMKTIFIILLALGIFMLLGSIGLLKRGETLNALFYGAIAIALMIPAIIMRNKSKTSTNVNDSHKINKYLAILFTLFYVGLGLISFLYIYLGYSPFTTGQVGIWRERYPVFDNMFQRIVYTFSLYSHLSLCLVPLAILPENINIIRIPILIGLAINILYLLLIIFMKYTYVDLYRSIVFMILIILLFLPNYIAIKLIITKYKQFENKR